ncbi:hypothetical protein GO988_17390 [Hymenobacter sp. HMF4947]|uniref:Uncharacterized protein n=1 Tax=Hymenobacter ginkgonis TaxID=2682976 RepID=A0A7K1TIF5_9BACT|nr:hypothetical protein [Hymenobacter ginkgonis]MVN78106.1 hypothetical protein [Hymenobacter ginkgonis]
MKHLLLLSLLGLTLVPDAQAQGALTVFNAISAARSMSANARANQQDPQEYTRPVVYEGEMFHYKRTPSAAYLRKGGAQIAVLERLLAERYTVLLADTVLILSPAWEVQYAEATKQVQYVLPTWSMLAYEDEVAFYRREDGVRRQWMEEVRIARQKRARRAARRDSLARLAQPLPIPATNK